MLGTRKARAIGPSAYIKAVLLSSAMVMPAMAQDDTQDETVVVTAQRGRAAQSVQDIPLAVTAISQKDLETKAIESFKDLQFNVPSVTYSNGNFGGNNFQIRGIGISSVATSADSGVSVHTNDVYQFGTSGLATGEYYDLERIEVLRGPQSTLYGRNATGGVVNIITAKPDLAEQYGRFDATYGEYNTAKFNLMANMPIVENELGLRVAYNFTHHDGYVENFFTGNDVNSQKLHQVRASLRWEPSESTTIDLIGSYSYEKDSRMRYPKQLCHRDPTGVMGCLPDRRGYDAVNSFATFGTLLSSQQGGLGPLFGLFDTTDIAGGNASSIVPKDNLEISADFDPTFEGDGVFYMGSLRQDINEWLTMTALVNYSDGSTQSRSHYNNLVGDDVSARLAEVVAIMRVVNPERAERYISTFFTAPDGSLQLPTSIPQSGGVTAGPEEGKTVLFSPRSFGFDEIGGSGSQTTAEVRFNSDFDGPINFLVAGFYIESESDATYYVNANSLDYAGIMYGFLSTLGAPAGSPLTVLSPTQFRSNTRLNSLQSRAVFGEVYYDAIPDELKFTFGLRWLEDEKRVVAQTTLLNYFAPLGTTEDDIDRLIENNGIDLDPSRPGAQPVQDSFAKFSQVTGRFVAEWTPDVSWSDDTLFYASYSRGFKSGGLNPPVSAGLFAVPATFEPEIIDAYEIGTKNAFDDNRLTLNLTGYYYDYKGYQIADIIARTAVNSNIDATVWGIEGEALYRVDENWQFSLTVAHTDTEIGEASIVDQRNPTAGVPNAVMVKDVANGANCVYLMNGAAGGLTPGENGFAGFREPNGGAQALAQYNVPNVNFGSCAPAFLNPASPAYNAAEAARFNAAYTLAPDVSGIRVDIEGNELPQQPKNTIAFGAQYTTDLGDGYELVLRGDYYWQGEMWARIINGPADKIDSWDVLNLSIQLNSEEGWYAKLFATNVLDSRELTGAYLTDASSGLFTNAFIQDPRVIGITVGADF